MPQWHPLPRLRPNFVAWCHRIWCRGTLLTLYEPTQGLLGAFLQAHWVVRLSSAFLVHRAKQPLLVVGQLHRNLAACACPVLAKSIGGRSLVREISPHPGHCNQQSPAPSRTPSRKPKARLDPQVTKQGSSSRVPSPESPSQQETGTEIPCRWVNHQNSREMQENRTPALNLVNPETRNQQQNPQIP